MNVLIIRLSALGDVAMTLPTLYSVATSHPADRFWLLSLPFHEKLLIDCPTNLRFIPIYPQGQHKGMLGLLRLFRQLKSMKFTHVADLHSVLRSWVLSTLFRTFTTAQVATIDKGRKQKRALTVRQNKVFKPIATTFKRYEEVFAQLGITMSSCTFTPFFGTKKESLATPAIGIAPFARYNEKSYPIALMKQVVEQLSNHENITIYLFGGGIEEQTILEKWESLYPRVISTVGKQNLSQELQLMARMKVMVTMDSANMHLASLVGTRVISIWGATHPYAGFYGWKQQPDDAIQTNLSCRPCSIFGNRPCHKSTLECLTSIGPQVIVNKIVSYV